MRCLGCGNEQMTVKHVKKTPTWAILVAIIFFPFGLFALASKKEYNLFICDKCGYRFKDEA